MEKDLLFWNEEEELGYYPVKGLPYDDSYFRDSVRNSKSPIAERLNKFRTKLVNSYVKRKRLVLDFGVGCGQFLHWRGNCLGYDICDKAVDWLAKEGLFFNPYTEDLDERGIEGVTFFDSLEHLHNPAEILDRITGQHVFISLPIFRDKDHVLKSKHLKTREHFWYFTQRSLRALMTNCGFNFLDCLDDETRIGREDIWTFVFRRENKRNFIRR